MESEDAQPVGPPSASSEATRARMRATRRRDTKPELALRRELHRRGWRYYVDRPPLPGLRRRADLVFPRRRVAVYVDGCFWHSCPIHATTPKTNTEWWRAKLAANRERDHDTDVRLRQAGWVTVRVWEHVDAAAAADEVEEAVRGAQKPAGSSGTYSVARVVAGTGGNERGLGGQGDD